MDDLRVSYLPSFRNYDDRSPGQAQTLTLPSELLGEAGFNFWVGWLWERDRSTLKTRQEMLSVFY